MPAGRSTVEPAFRPASFVVGAAVSGLALAGLVLGLWLSRLKAGRAGRNGG